MTWEQSSLYRERIIEKMKNEGDVAEIKNR